MKLRLLRAWLALSLAGLVALLLGGCRSAHGPGAAPSGVERLGVPPAAAPSPAEELPRSAPAPPAPAPPTPSCVAGATSVQTANAGTRRYSYTRTHEAVEARGVSWLRLEGEDGVRIRGSAPGCWSGGRISGPYLPGVAVYECSPDHCPNGNCPHPCLPYHTTAGMQMAANGPPLTIEDVCIEHYGDGISMYKSSGDIVVRRAHFRETLDDAIENDFCDGSVRVEDSFFDDIGMGLANRLRSSASGDCTDKLWEVRNSLFKIRRAPYSYREGDRPGQRGPYLHKLNPGPNNPRFAFTDNVFVFERPSGEDGSNFPPLDRLAECARNVVLFAGTPRQTQAILAEGGNGDGLRNGQRLATLVATGCYQRADRLGSETEEQFLARRLDVLGGKSWNEWVADWKAAHPQSMCP